MKCPNCWNGLVDTDENDDFCASGKDCPDCRGTGEIQDGDWWMVSARRQGETPMMKIFLGWKSWQNEPQEDFSGRFNFRDRDIKPLYRMERAK